MASQMVAAPERQLPRVVDVATAETSQAYNFARKSELARDQRVL